MTTIDTEFFLSTSKLQMKIADIENDITKALVSASGMSPMSSQERPQNGPQERPPNGPQEQPPNVAPVSTTTYRSPEVKWAQRVDKIYLTVLLSEAKNAKVNLTPDGVFTFSATAGTENHAYELKLDLFGKVNVEGEKFLIPGTFYGGHVLLLKHKESKINMGTRTIFCVIEKDGEGWWKKLLRGDQKIPHYLKVDWDKWVDEDEDEDTSDLDLGGMDFSKFGGMDGLGGMEDGLDDDSSDEDEEVEKPGKQ